ncbi:hypothetical protein HUT06_29895 [Actinomadura sp. NAK00032]|uniref:hypothetical protein n=1 Tax=Actinomadura sp. NAK00032 TaxID=2742128 RepID=UPI0015928BB1|nr:hypothetical protein [Actinomadura sp. NAK00032]QKW37704.1 hypothetical protein HUT06_29895 [Actinomadura sp. NAK00032]
MTAAKAGWTVFCSESVCDVMESKPALREFFVEFFCDFAAKAGTAVDLGLAPPGRPQAEPGVYSLLVESSGIFIEYAVMADIKEFLISKMLYSC